MNAMTPVDPAALGYPPSLPVELALKVAPARDLCLSYGLTREDWDRLRKDEAFRAHVQRVVDDVKEYGFAFKLKAQLQAEALLRTSWALIHDDNTPHNVRADLIKNTMRVAGLDASKDQGKMMAQMTGLQINISL